MPRADYAREEISARGEAIYMEQIFPTLGESETGKHVSIEIESGDYEIDADQINAMLRIRERRPGGVYFGVRVGYWSPEGRPVAGYLGYRPL